MKTTYQSFTRGRNHMILSPSLYVQFYTVSMEEEGGGVPQTGIIETLRGWLCLT